MNLLEPVDSLNKFESIVESSVLWECNMKDPPRRKKAFVMIS